MTTTIRTDASGTFGALQVNGSDVLRFGADNSGQLAGFRNKIINGGMQVHQRTGTISVGGSFTYTLDRWLCLAAGANINVLQASYGSGYRFSNALVIEGAVGNTIAQVQQRIEGKNISGCVGKTFTVSAELYSTDAITINWVVRYANTVDNYSSTTNLASGSVSIPSGSYTNRYFSFVVPGGYANTGIEVILYVNGLLAGKQLGFANIQLEEGSVATPFENRPYGLELALCRRYAKPVVRSIGQCIAATQSNHYFDVSDMRTNPTLSTTAGWLQSIASGGTVASTPALNTIVNGDIQIVTTSSGLVTGNSSTLIPTTGALFVAEL